MSEEHKKGKLIQLFHDFSAIYAEEKQLKLVKDGLVRFDGFRGVLATCLLVRKSAKLAWLKWETY